MQIEIVDDGQERNMSFADSLTNVKYQVAVCKDNPEWTCLNGNNMFSQSQPVFKIGNANEIVVRYN